MRWKEGDRGKGGGDGEGEGEIGDKGRLGETERERVKRGKTGNWRQLKGNLIPS